MKITVITVGKIKERYLKDAIAEYSKRLSKYCKLEIVEVAEKQEEVLVEAKEEKVHAEDKVLDLNKPYEEMTIAELQASILAKMAKNGPVTEDMERTVTVNTHQGSLLNWVRSFNQTYYKQILRMR